MMKRSVPATPTGAFSTTTSWPFSAMYLAVFSQQYSWNTMVALACSAASTVGLGGAALVHAELAVGGRVPHLRRVAQHVHLRAEQVEDALDLLHVADHEAVEAADEVDAVVGHAHQRLGGLGLAVPEVLQHAQQRVVVAGDVAAHEGRRVREGHVELGRHAALFLGRLDEGVQVVADHLGHAGGADGDHVRLVQVVGVGQAVDHVVQAAEHRRVFRHRRADAGRRLLEVAAEVAAVVGHAALRAVHEAQRLGKAVGHVHRAQRLAGLGRVDGERLAGEVLVLVVLALGPVADLRDPASAWLNSKFAFLSAKIFWYSGSRNSSSWSMTLSAVWGMVFSCLALWTTIRRLLLPGRGLGELPDRAS
jgi:hypothetical protein